MTADTAYRSDPRYVWGSYGALATLVAMFVVAVLMTA